MSITDQIPTQSGFVAKTDGSVVIADIDLAGKTAIVTGGYSGIGLEPVRALVDNGVQVIVPVRSPEQARKALAEINGDVQTLTMDLADLASVKRFAEAALDQLNSLDMLINNPGIMASPDARVRP